MLRTLDHGRDPESQPGVEVLGTLSSPEGLCWIEPYEYSWNVTYGGQVPARGTTPRERRGLIPPVDLPNNNKKICNCAEGPQKVKLTSFFLALGSTTRTLTC